MNMQHKEVVGHADAQAAQPNAVTATLGKSFARKYYSVMVIFVSLVASQADTCQPATLTTY